MGQAFLIMESQSQNREQLMRAKEGISLPTQRLCSDPSGQYWFLAALKQDRVILAGKDSWKIYNHRGSKSLRRKVD